MYDFKSIFASKTVWTAFIGFVLAVLVALGVVPTTVDAAQITGIVFAVITALTGLFRIKATAQLAVDPQKAAARAGLRHR